MYRSFFIHCFSLLLAFHLLLDLPLLVACRLLLALTRYESAVCLVPFHNAPSCVIVIAVRLIAVGGTTWKCTHVVRFHAKDALFRCERCAQSFVLIARILEEVIVRIRCAPRYERRTFISQIFLPLRLVLASAHAVHRFVSRIIKLLIEGSFERVRVILTPCREGCSLSPQFVFPRCHYSCLASSSDSRKFLRFNSICLSVCSALFLLSVTGTGTRSRSRSLLLPFSFLLRETPISDLFYISCV